MQRIHNDQQANTQIRISMSNMKQNTNRSSSFALSLHHLQRSLERRFSKRWYYNMRGVRWKVCGKNLPIESEQACKFILDTEAHLSTQQISATLRPNSTRANSIRGQFVRSLRRNKAQTRFAARRIKRENRRDLFSNDQSSRETRGFLQTKAGRNRMHGRARKRLLD